jgi:hypothetical protein
VVEAVTSAGMLDSRTTWLRRLGTVSGIAIVVLGLYTGFVRSTYHCPASTPQRQFACDPGPPSHPHIVLGLLIAVGGVGVLVGSRRLFAYFDE